MRAIEPYGAVWVARDRPAGASIVASVGRLKRSPSFTARPQAEGVQPEPNIMRSRLRCGSLPRAPTKNGSRTLPTSGRTKTRCAGGAARPVSPQANDWSMNARYRRGR